MSDYDMLRAIIGDVRFELLVGQLSSTVILRAGETGKYVTEINSQDIDTVIGYLRACKLKLALHTANRLKDNG